MPKPESLQTQILRRAASNGFYLGLIMIFQMILILGSSHNALFSLLALASFIVVPVVLYRFLARSYRQSGAMLSFSAVWLEGIFSFLFGSLILSVYLFVYFKWLDPEYFYRTLNEIIDVNEATGAFAEFAVVARRTIEAHLIPTVKDVVMLSIWTVSFTGSILSLIITPLVRYNNRVPST